MTSEEAERLVYDQLSESYRGIDDFRAKLLGFLPLATGAGILFAAKEVPSLLLKFSLPIGIFGFLITLGLFCYEIYGIKKCSELIWVGRKLELALKVHGQFVSRPPAVLRVINEPFAAGVIYPAVLASWTVMWFIRTDAQDKLQILPAAWLSAVLVLLGGFALTLRYDYRLKKKRSGKEQCDGCGSPLLNGESTRARITTLQTSPDFVLCGECGKALIPWLHGRRST